MILLTKRAPAPRVIARRYDETISNLRRHRNNSITAEQIPRVDLLLNIPQLIGHAISDNHITQ